MLTHPELLFPLILFCIVAFFTPGPNNVMLLSNGLSFGFRRSVGAFLGVACGFGFLGFCVGMGLGAVFTSYPVVYIVLKYVGGLYLLYLAYKIAKAEPHAPETQQLKKPVNFFQAALLQWVNPKGWVIAISAIATYTPIASYPLNIYLIAALFVVIGIASSSTWAGMGAGMQRFLHRPKIVRAFNIVMALLLVASLYPLLTE